MGVGTGSLARKRISSGSPFEALAGYSRAVADGDWCWVSGSTGYDPDTRVVPDDVAQQAANALRVIEEAMAGCGFSLADTVKVTYFITDPRWWDEILPVIGATFGDIRPAATCLVCGLIKPEMKIEIEITAKKRA